MGWKSQRIVGKSSAKEDPISRQPVDIRCFYLLASITAQLVRSQSVNRDEEHIPAVVPGVFVSRKKEVAHNKSQAKNQQDYDCYVSVELCRHLSVVTHISCIFPYHRLDCDELFFFQKVLRTPKEFDRWFPYYYIATAVLILDRFITF